MSSGEQVITAEDLRRDFGLSVAALEPHVGGFESDCWVADERWFVKWWKAVEVPSGLGMVRRLAELGLPVVAPISGVDGELSAVVRGRACAVFPYVTGRTADAGDWRVMARALRQVHEVTEDLGLPRFTKDEPEIRELAGRLDHPWIVDRQGELVTAIERLDAVIGRAAAKDVPEVLCHQDFGGLNLIIDDNREVAAILDWEQAVIGPREHDVWIAAEGPCLTEFLDEYGVHDLDLDHLEYALLARALRDLAARVLGDTDRPGVDTWGFDRIARLDSDLDVFRAYCR